MKRMAIANILDFAQPYSGLPDGRRVMGSRGSRSVAI